MTAAEYDVVTVLDTCRMFFGVLSHDDLRLFSGLPPARLWDATRIISETGLVNANTGRGAGWPTNEAVLSSHRASTALALAAA